MSTFLANDEFSGLSSELLKYGVLLNEMTATEHILEIERRIRVVKERYRGRVNTVPFKLSRLPKLIYTHSVLQASIWFNMFPSRGGVSKTISPHSLVRGRKLDFNRHCRVPFGAYCEVHNEANPSNTSMSRTAGVVSLGSNGNLQGDMFSYR